MSVPEKTFQSYTSEQAHNYSLVRPTYPPALYTLILDYHFSHGGKFTTLFDVGCGPGNATRDLAVHFENAIGCDAGEGMMEAARGIGGKSGTGKDIRWVVGRGEDMSAVEDGVVDILSVASEFSVLRG